MLDNLTKETQESLFKQIKEAKDLSLQMSILSEADKNEAIDLIARELLESSNYIIEANAEDLKMGKADGLSSALLDRLTLNEQRLNSMVNGLRNVINIKDPVGQVLDGWTHPRGMQIQKVQVPLGVIGIIYEARPNVTTDAVALCIKSGNSCVLRGSQQAWQTNLALMDVIYRALKESKVPAKAVQYLQDKSRDSAKILLRAEGLIDLVIPRGGNKLKDFVNDNALIPVLGAGGGICHVYIDQFADPVKAVDIVLNAKTQRPGVCNACETVLIHNDIKEQVLPLLINRLSEAGVEIRADQGIQAFSPGLIPATNEDWSTEYLDLIISLKTVTSVTEAIAHINHYSTGHSDAIVTEDINTADIFKRTISSACVYVNASTRFTDGEEFGFGAEIGISTQKMHARGPIGLKELCSYKYIIEGNGQIR